MRNINKVIFSLASVALLASCNSGKLASKTDEEALAIATEIAKRQKDSSLFTLPTKITINGNSNSSYESKDPQDGLSKNTTSSSTLEVIDIDNLKYRKVTKSNQTNSESSTEVIEFYNKSNGIYYVTTNMNGYKIRTEEDCKEDAAKQKIKNKIQESSITRNYYFEGLKTLIEIYQTTHKKYEAENDQYFNYSFGSNDPKSFQEIISSKLKTEQKLSYSIEINGYSTIEANTLFEKDMFVSSSSTISYDLKSSDGLFYKKYSSNENSHFTYGSADISIPNISDYKKI